MTRNEPWITRDNMDLSAGGVKHDSDKSRIDLIAMEERQIGEDDRSVNPPE